MSTAYNNKKKEEKRTRKLFGHLTPTATPFSVIFARTRSSGNFGLRGSFGRQRLLKELFTEDMKKRTDRKSSGFKATLSRIGQATKNMFRRKV